MSAEEVYQPHRVTREPIPDADGWVYGVAWADDDGTLRVSGPRHRDEAVEAVAVLRGAPVALGTATEPDPGAAWLVRARPLAWEREPDTNGEQN